MSLELLNDNNRKIGLIGCFQGASVIQSWLPENFLNGTEFYVSPEQRCSDSLNPRFVIWNKDGVLYENMLKKIIPFSLNSIVWYQGESNFDGQESKAAIYGGILKLLIEKWRNDFIDKDLPFVIIQLHDYIPRIQMKDSGWRDIQSAQEAVCKSVKNTLLVKSADVSEKNQIHPLSKMQLALRIARVVKGMGAKRYEV